MAHFVIRSLIRSKYERFWVRCGHKWSNPSKQRFNRKLRLLGGCQITCMRKLVNWPSFLETNKTRCILLPKINTRRQGPERDWSVLRLLQHRNSKKGLFNLEFETLLKLKRQCQGIHVPIYHIVWRWRDFGLKNVTSIAGKSDILSKGKLTQSTPYLLLECASQTWVIMCVEVLIIGLIWHVHNNML